MAIEEQHLAYYDSILQGKSYIDDRLQIQIAILDYMSKTFFGGDLKRVVYTNPEYAFRKRIEALSNGIDGENIFISNLQLPFASFNLTGAPEIIKSVSASEWSGYYDTDLEQIIHFANEKYKAAVQFFFDRSDDASVAYRIAQFEQHSGYPVKYVQTVYWRNKALEIPVFITIKNIVAGNESFNETQWLTKNHMFAMTLELEIETASLHVHRGINAIQLPFKWHATGNIDTWQDGQKEYYTQKCILMWAEKAWHFDCTAPEEPTQDAIDLAEEIKDVELEAVDKATLKQIQSVVPNGATVEMVQGYFKDPVKILFNVLKYNADKTTVDDKGEVTAWIDCVVKPSTYQYWDYTDVYIPSRKGGAITIKNCKDKYVQLDGLHPNSTYTVYFVAHDINGDFNTITLTFTTPKWEKETLPDITSVAPDALVKPSGADKDKPTIVKGKGLIGLEV